jgi:hypothetical protein
MFDFMRCYDCGRLITKIEIDEALGVGGTGEICSCGSAKASPSNPRFYEYLYPRVVYFAYQRLRGLA